MVGPVEVEWKVSDPNGDELEVAWTIALESTDLKHGGDAETAPEQKPVEMESLEEGKMGFVAPKEPGNYRLFVVVKDGKGAATAGNFPFQAVGSF